MMTKGHYNKLKIVIALSKYQKLLEIELEFRFHLNIRIRVH